MYAFRCQVVDFAAGERESRRMSSRSASVSASTGVNGDAHARRRNHAAQVVDVLAQRQVDARLVLEADDRQVLVEHLGRAVAIAGRELA